MTGELDGRTFPGPMLPHESYDDEWIAATLTYVRHSLGNNAPMVSAADVAAVRAAVKDRREMWQSAEILDMTPVSKNETKTWVLTASSNQGNCRAAMDGRADSRWDTQGTQHDGMWFAFDMGSEKILNSIVLDAAGSSADYPREYSVDFSSDGKTWNQAVAKTRGTDAVTDILLPAIKTRWVRINQHGQSPDKFWSIHELEVYAKP